MFRAGNLGQANVKNIISTIFGVLRGLREPSEARSELFPDCEPRMNCFLRSPTVAGVCSLFRHHGEADQSVIFPVSHRNLGRYWDGGGHQGYFSRYRCLDCAAAAAAAGSCDAGFSRNKV